MAKQRLDETMKPGSWVETELYGPAVLIKIVGDFVYFRYEAIRMIDGKTIWVLNGAPLRDVKLTAPLDDVSQKVLAMKGPYGV